MTVLAARNGLDLALATHRPHPGVIAALAAIAADNGIARIAVNGDVAVQRSAPVLPLAGVDVVPPPGAFVQAAETAEQDITRLLLGAIGKSRRVADLFCGLGTFTFAIARHARVLAVDGDAAAVAALGAAALRAQGLKPIETRTRDLFREPLSARELKGFDAVVFDPPRAGAKAQAAHLARSDVGLVAAVSCDPGTLARDVRILVDGGYHLESVTPIDQFLYSAHVEAVAVLRRR
jgi:23S rRNA (uracil1939-C5)-methyltransferase